jgi:hypothetical protein
MMFTIFLYVAFLSLIHADQLGLFHKQLLKIHSSVVSHKPLASSTPHLSADLQSSQPSITNYTAYMHIYTVDGNDAVNNWNATLVEYFTKYPNGDSHARDDNFYISLGNGYVAEDSVQWNFCFANLPDQDTYVLTYPLNPSTQQCIVGSEPNYDQGCISYFVNLPNSPYRGSCHSPYSEEEGDAYILNVPGTVYLEYCLKKGSLSMPHYFKSIIENVTMTVIFAMFNDYAPPEKLYAIPELCNQQKH